MANSARVVVKTALRMTTTPIRVNRLPGGDALGEHALPVWTVPVRVRLVIRLILRLNARSTFGRVQVAGSRARQLTVKTASGALIFKAGRRENA
jgi:hypothetical protein